MVITNSILQSWKLQYVPFNFFKKKKQVRNVKCGRLLLFFIKWHMWCVWEWRKWHIFIFTFFRKMTTCRECIHKGKSFLLPSGDIACIVGNEFLVGQRWVREWRFKGVLVFMVKTHCWGCGWPSRRGAAGRIIRTWGCGKVSVAASWLMIIPFLYLCRQETF